MGGDSQVGNDRAPSMRLDPHLLSGMGVLAAVIEGGSFTRAGELLGLSASGVSRAIARLEERVGVRLLDRTTRSSRLTNEGAHLYEFALPHLAGIQEVANAASGFAVAVKGSLRVSLNAIFSRHILAPNLPRFSRRYPALELTILHLPDSGDLITGGVDLSIRFGPQPPSTMSSRLLLETRVLTVAAPSYLEKNGRPMTPEDLAKHDCIHYVDPQRGKPFEWEFHRDEKRVSVKTRGLITVHDCDTMVMACVAGAGVAQVLALGNQHLLSSGALIELFPDWPGETFPLYAIRPSRRLAPAKVDAFLNFCSQICKESENSPAALRPPNNDYRRARRANTAI
jgi:DNA-binding transcriptional LysR family regulator